jgi:hypothetical protein
MNVLTTTWRQLVRRRLWPVALLLLAALTAVPFLLARDPQPAVTSAPIVTAKADDAVAEPVVAKASPEDRARRRRVLGATKDPFEPAPLPKPTKQKKRSTKHVTPVQTGSKPVGSGGTSMPVAPTLPTLPGPVSVTPAPKEKTYPKGSVIVRFGDATGDALPRSVVKKLSPLPDDKDPLLVYTGLTDHGKKAVFLLDASLSPTGDGECRPHPSDCETVELAKGETEFFDVVDPETGEITAQYELDLVAIK